MKQYVITETQLNQMKDGLKKLERKMAEKDFLLMVAEEEAKIAQQELEKAFAIIEELTQENGNLVKSLEDMELLLRKGCACTRVWE